MFINRHGDPTQNVLAVCDFSLKFTYILAGWEGSAHDAHVLQDSLERSTNRLTVPRGRYYLVDAGYAHVPSFMAPCKGVSYHMSNFGSGRSPRNNEELFNFRHTYLRSTIERFFAMWKKRFPSMFKREDGEMLYCIQRSCTWCIHVMAESTKSSQWF